MKRLPSFFAVLAGSASVVGVIYIAFTLVMGTDWINENRLIVLTHGIYWLILPPIVWSMRGTAGATVFMSPKVRKVLENNILLVDTCDWLNHQTGVAIYYIEDEAERLLCVGQVINIQTNGLIQIQVLQDEPQPNFEETLNSRRANLLIKPGIVQ